MDTRKRAFEVVEVEDGEKEDGGALKRGRLSEKEKMVHGTSTVLAGLPEQPCGKQ